MDDPDRDGDERELFAMQDNEEMPETFARVESMNHAMRTAQLGEPAWEILNRAGLYYQFLKTGAVPDQSWTSVRGAPQ